MNRELYWYRLDQSGAEGAATYLLGTECLVVCTMAD
jgi:hypothetical protein